MEEQIDSVQRRPFTRMLPRDPREGKIMLLESITDVTRIGFTTVADEQCPHLKYRIG